MASRPAARRPRALLGLPIAGALLLGACAFPDDDHSDMGGDGVAPPRVGTAAPGPTPSAAVDPTAPCPESGVRIRSLGTEAAMGLRALGLELVNCGARPYPLNGHPVLRLLDGDGRPVAVRVVDGAAGITSGFDDPPRPLTLRPGERAGAAVLWRNLVTDPTVVATEGERLEVAPAVGRPPQIVDPDGPIDLGNTGRIGVSAWKKLDPAATETASPDAPTPSGSAPLL
jgi:hypothetical protein